MFLVGIKRELGLLGGRWRRWKAAQYSDNNAAAGMLKSTRQAAEPLQISAGPLHRNRPLIIYSLN